MPSSSAQTTWVLASLLGSTSKPTMDEQCGCLCTVLPTPAVSNLSQPLILENGELIVAQNYTTSIALAGLPMWSIKFKVTITFFSPLSLYLMNIFLILLSGKTEAEIVQVTYKVTHQESISQNID